LGENYECSHWAPAVGLDILKLKGEKTGDRIQKTDDLRNNQHFLYNQNIFTRQDPFVNVYIDGWPYFISKMTLYPLYRPLCPFCHIYLYW